MRVWWWACTPIRCVLTSRDNTESYNILLRIHHRPTRVHRFRQMHTYAYLCQSKYAHTPHMRTCVKANTHIRHICVLTERRQATEPIVDAALAACVPFAVVPCCVFPSLFPDRSHQGVSLSLLSFDHPLCFEALNISFSINMSSRIKHAALSSINMS